MKEWMLVARCLILWIIFARVVAPDLSLISSILAGCIGMVATMPFEAQASSSITAASSKEPSKGIQDE
jgi:AMMECR1 domain-containing protein